MNYDLRDKYINCEMTESDMKGLLDGVLESILDEDIPDTADPEPAEASPVEAPSGTGRKILW